MSNTKIRATSIALQVSGVVIVGIVIGPGGAAVMIAFLVLLWAVLTAWDRP